MNAARIKVEAEGACRVCGHGPAHRLDAAHVIARGIARDDFSEPSRIVPLCSRGKHGPGCHDDYDAGTLDLLPYLTVAEQVHAVATAGGIADAYRRITGSTEPPAATPLPF